MHSVKTHTRTKRKKLVFLFSPLLCSWISNSCNPPSNDWSLLIDRNAKSASFSEGEICVRRSFAENKKRTPNWPCVYVCLYHYTATYTAKLDWSRIYNDMWYLLRWADVFSFRFLFFHFTVILCCCFCARSFHYHSNCYWWSLESIIRHSKTGIPLKLSDDIQ